MAAAPYGVDNVVYGSGQPAYAPAATPAYQTAPAPSYRGIAGMNFAPPAAPTYGAATPDSGSRGFFTSNYAVTPPAVHRVAPTPAYAAPAAPSYSVTTAPSYAIPAAPPYGVAVPPATYASAEQQAYTLDSGDRLRIVVFGQDGLTNSYVVDASGDIAMPLIGSVGARGLTTDQLSARIAELLRHGYVRDPHVAVEVEAYRPFFILGEVAQPGQYPYVANMTVETAVAIAGGFGPRGYKESVIISRNSGGRTYRFEAPITASICPGDTIKVQERWF